jgi:hypothetical protein
VKVRRPEDRRGSNQQKTAMNHGLSFDVLPE